MPTFGPPLIDQIIQRQVALRVANKPAHWANTLKHIVSEANRRVVHAVFNSQIRAACHMADKAADIVPVGLSSRTVGLGVDQYAFFGTRPILAIRTRLVGEDISNGIGAAGNFADQAAHIIGVGIDIQISQAEVLNRYTTGGRKQAQVVCNLVEQIHFVDGVAQTIELAGEAYDRVPGSGRIVNHNILAKRVFTGPRDGCQVCRRIDDGVDVAVHRECARAAEVDLARENVGSLQHLHVARATGGQGQAARATHTHHVVHQNTVMRGECQGVGAPAQRGGNDDVALVGAIGGAAGGNGGGCVTCDQAL